MSRRVTRSSARLAADTSSTLSDTPSIPTTIPTSLTNPAPPRNTTQHRKRKAIQPESPSAEDTTSRKTKKAKIVEVETTPPIAKSKRGKKTAQASAMSGGYDEGETNRRTSSSRRHQGSPPAFSAETSPNALSTSTSRRRSSRKKGSQPAITPSGSSTKRNKKGGTRKDHSTPDNAHQSPDEQMDEEQMQEGLGEEHEAESEDRADEEEPTHQEDERMDDDDPFSSSLLGRGPPSGLSNTLRALSGMMSGMTGRLRGILENLRQKDDPSVQLIALTELSEILLVSNEDNLAGHFSPDQFVKELVVLMQPNDFGEENPEMMLLACRCIANLIEAVPAATASVVYGGAVSILCQKLLEIHYIDLAEQALTTLEKISVDFPSSIVREGGLTACLTYLDFFATSTQRSAVTTAANCCRNIPEECFPVVRDVMPILLNVLNSNDQRVVEQGSLCVCRVIESFKWQETKLEELVSPDLLRAIVRLLLPGTTNMIGANLHAQFLRVLAIIARASPRLSVELLRMNVVETLYQILTGISPPSGVDDIATKIDKNVIMQALIRTPRDQIFETLNVICELLPAVQRDSLMFLDDLDDAGYTGGANVSMATRSRTSPNDKRTKLLEACPEELRRFAVVLFPTLMHAYTSTVNLSVRQKVLTAQLKMLSNLELPVVKEALQGVAYASHLASILSQQDNPSLITFALQAAELLLKRLESTYRPQFYREGVMAETSRLAQRSIQRPVPTSNEAKADNPVQATVNTDDKHDVSRNVEPTEENQARDAEEHDEKQDHQSDDDDDEDDDHEDSDSQDSDDHSPNNDVLTMNIRDVITHRARKFMTTYGQPEDDREQEATQVVRALRALSEDLRKCYAANDGNNDGVALFVSLSHYFSSDSLEGITSYELLTSGIVDALLEVFSTSDVRKSAEARSAFLQTFMSISMQGKIATGSADSPATAFSVIVHKLQDLLSRTEHFEVLTVHQNAFESNKSSASSMLAKQLRLKLSADDDSGIPKHLRNIMVSIQAIATFRALDDYLRPRISLEDRPRGGRKSEGLLSEILGKQFSTTSPGPGALSGISPAPSLLGDTRGPPSTYKSDGTVSGTGSADDPPSQVRRSSRRFSTRPAPDVATPRSGSDRKQEENANPLECADQTNVSDDDTSADQALNTVVDGLQEGSADEEDPSAVNLEVAGSGKITARKEDGTRVSTPLQGSQSSTDSRASAAAARIAAAQQMFSTPTSMARAMSYASALQAVPDDWHIEFSIDGQTIANDTTIYRAVHFDQTNPEEVAGRLVWSNLHKITFKRVPGPPPADTGAIGIRTESTEQTADGLPASLSCHPQTASILQLMSILHSMNENLDDIVVDQQASLTLNAEPLAQFVNTKLTAKLNRQLEEPLIVASNCLPSWAEDLARLYPFLFPFETRHLFLQSTSFGYSRSMSRWQHGQSETQSRRHRDERPYLGRTQRQKVRISRLRILESALKVMELYGSSPSILEVEYFEEVGTGLGPTLEFYSTVSKEFSKKKLKMWRENEAETDSEFAFGKRGLFPAPMSEAQLADEKGKRVLHLFKLLGKFVARSMLDSRIIDVFFNPSFFRIGDGLAGVGPSFGSIASVDQSLANSLKDLTQAIKTKASIDQDSTMSPSQRAEALRRIEIKGVQVEQLGLDFTLPGYAIELVPNGSDIDVTIDNVEQYVERVLDYTLGTGVRQQIEAFRAGFSQVFPYQALKAFTPAELVILFGQAEEDWSLETLMDSIKADHGFNLDSSAVRSLLHVMSGYKATEQRDFLQFVTGSPKLPIGGFKSLTPMFTVVCKPSEPPLTSDDYLPSVMTCVNYLKMPDYSTIDVLKAKLDVAIREGQGAFHLS